MLETQTANFNFLDCEKKKNLYPPKLGDATLEKIGYVFKNE